MTEGLNQNYEEIPGTGMGVATMSGTDLFSSWYYYSRTAEAELQCWPDW